MRSTPGLHDAGDDLQAIKGVGPAIEKTLHELGIFRYSQIAEMSEYDINRVAERLKGFRSRHLPRGLDRPGTRPDLPPRAA